MSLTTTLRFATRASALAVAQSSWTVAQFAAVYPEFSFELVRVVTEGDRVQDRPLYEVGGKGLFVREIETALLEQRAHFAVHSMKDLPAELGAGFAITSVPARESPWDILLTEDNRSLSELRTNAKVGTSSLRRKLQLLDARPDLEILPLRGNIDTRMKKLEAGHYDAVVLAEAGLKRLGIAKSGVRLDRELVPAIGQGALAVEARLDDLRQREPSIALVASALEHADTRVATDAERAVQLALEADCVTPVGAHATIDRATDTIEIAGFLAAADGSRLARGQVRGPLGSAQALGRELAVTLLSRLNR